MVEGAYKILACKTLATPKSARPFQSGVSLPLLQNHTWPDYPATGHQESRRGAPTAKLWHWSADPTKNGVGFEKLWPCVIMG